MRRLESQLQANQTVSRRTIQGLQEDLRRAGVRNSRCSDSAAELCGKKGAANGGTAGQSALEPPLADATELSNGASNLNEVASVVSFPTTSEESATAAGAATSGLVGSSSEGGDEVQVPAANGDASLLESETAAGAATDALIGASSDISPLDTSRGADMSPRTTFCAKPDAAVMGDGSTAALHNLTATPVPIEKGASEDDTAGDKSGTMDQAAKPNGHSGPANEPSGDASHQLQALELVLAYKQLLQQHQRAKREWKSRLAALQAQLAAAEAARSAAEQREAAALAAPRTADASGSSAAHNTSSSVDLPIAGDASNPSAALIDESPGTTIQQFQSPTIGHQPGSGPAEGLLPHDTHVAELQQRLSALQASYDALQAEAVALRDGRRQAASDADADAATQYQVRVEPSH